MSEAIGSRTMEKKSVLLIEDKEVVGTLIRDILIGTGRYEVVYAPSGYEGLMKIIGDGIFTLPSDTDQLEKTINGISYKGLRSLPMSRHFDLVISDVRMPGMDGLRTLKLVRKLCPEQTCILITGYGTEDYRSDLEDIRPDAILRKPITNDELVQAVDLACGMATQPSEPC